MQFRTDISFLRAISVLMVMFFHYGIFGFSGGFLGVDVFFVISGFLMTGIILKGFDTDSFTLKQFYLKRIKRIIPALSVVLIFVLLISIIFFFQTNIRLNAKYVFLADFFVSNIYFWKYQDYFASGNNILLHSWTLGVEWQFYLIYPIILLILKPIYRKNIKLFWIILSVLTFTSLLLMLFLYKSASNFTFYMLPTRYWELSIGGLAYFISKKQNNHKVYHKIAVILGIMTILGSSFLISKSNLWPSFLTLIPVFATALILGMNVNFSLFRNSIVTFLGNISYSLYLWHWPWWILFAYFRFTEPLHIFFIIVLSVLSAFLSYKFIETKKKTTTIRLGIITTGLIGVLSFVLFFRPYTFRSFSIYQSDKFAIGDYGFKYLNEELNKQFNPCGCFVSNDQTEKDYNYDKCLKILETKPNILLLGDSHSAEFSESLRKLSDYNLLEASIGNTLPVINSKGKPGLIELNDFVFNKFLPENKTKIQLVLISAHWLMRHSAYTIYDENELLGKIEETINYFNKENIPYLFIGQTEAYDYEYVRYLVLKEMGRFDNEDENIKKEAGEINNQLKRLIPKENYIDIYRSSLINKYDKEGNRTYMFDDNHLTNYGTDQLVEKIIGPRIIEKLNK